MRVPAGLLAGLVATGLATLPARATEPACTLVVGHGRNLDLKDDEANTAWNRVNNLLNAQVAGQLQAGGERVVRLPLPVEARDMPSNVRSMLERAQDAGCDRLLETTLFADEAAQLLVVRIRLHPLQRVRNLAGDGQLLNIGAPVYSNQRDMRLVLRTLDQLAPAELAREMVADLVQRQPR
jgi:hypothetical protein